MILRDVFIVFVYCVLILLCAIMFATALQQRNTFGMAVFGVLIIVAAAAVVDKL